MILKGEKIILRPIRLSDAGRFIKWFNDVQVSKFLVIRKMTLKQERKWIREQKKDKTKINFSIDTKEGMHIGSIGLVLRTAANRQSRNASFGIMIGDKKYWDKGYGSDASKILLDYGFKKLKLHRIELDVYEYNPRAIKVYKRLGFRLEGVKRELTFYKGKYYYALHMSILDWEWRKKKI